MKKATTLILAGFLSLAFSAMAQTGPPSPSGDYKMQADLELTKLGGTLFDAFGVAVKSVQNGVETFAVRVFADSRDGTHFEVMIVTADSKYDVGAIRTVLGSGALVLKSSTDPSPAFPVARIVAVLVTYRGELILEGLFPESGAPR